jgi:hypothetical protein
MRIKNSSQKTSSSFQYGVTAPCYSTTFPGKSIYYRTGSKTQGVTMLSDRKDDHFLFDMQHVLNSKKI